jgi:hypothetical protein
VPTGCPPFVKGVAKPGDLFLLDESNQLSLYSNYFNILSSLKNRRYVYKSGNNLDAFRELAFDYSGKIQYAFGKRGQSINDFHGCCNPVNVTSLTNGAIVTVEKDPTRIKVYSKSGAKQIAGIQELVKGCRYIPMVSDSKNNLYLASAQSGIIKCSPQ